MRVVIVDDMLGDDRPEDALDGVCDRCGALVDDEDVTEISVSFAHIGSAEWFWCERCADSFTAWRLTPALASSPASSGPDPDGIDMGC